MFFSSLLLIPWIIFGFRHPSVTFLGLHQTRKSLLTLLLLEMAYFIVLVMLLDKPDPTVAGQGSFSWIYMLIYEKGIFPLLLISECMNPASDAMIDNEYKGFFFSQHYSWTTSY
jgi:hypothetical protein